MTDVIACQQVRLVLVEVRGDGKLMKIFIRVGSADIGVPANVTEAAPN